ncbi:MAG: flagellar basal body protein, partial [Alphaproteobacteria bacterium]
MISALETAVSGLNAASKRVEAVASNLANIESTRTERPVEAAAPVNPVQGVGAESYQGYRPVSVEQKSLANGGTEAVVRQVDPPSVPVFDPGNPDANPDGVVQLPNVQPEVQLTELMRAQHAYEAGL